METLLAGAEMAAAGSKASPLETSPAPSPERVPTTLFERALGALAFFPLGAVASWSALSPSTWKSLLPTAVVVGAMHPMGLFISILSLALYSCIMIPLLACVGGLCGSVAAYFSVSPHALRAVALALLSLQPPIMKVHTAAKEALRGEARLPQPPFRFASRPA
jgi:hypothetical protein